MVGNSLKDITATLPTELVETVQAKRGTVFPVDFIEQVVEGGAKERLQAWLAAPQTPFYVMHIAGSWFSS
jgi:hypothetical protein